MKIEFLSWDSDFFGLKSGRLFLSKDDEWNERELEDWDLVYIFVEPEDRTHNSILQKKGVPLIDEKITYVMDVSLQKPENDLINIYPYVSSDDDDKVINIGIQSGLFSRFYMDTNIPKTKFEELYTIWMKRSINRELANEVLVYKTDKDQIGGVITIGEKNNRADIGIIAVDKDLRGQHIGRTLVQGAINYSIQNEYDSLQVVTQKMNKSACMFYESMGFSQEHLVNVYHYRN